MGSPRLPGFRVGLGWVLGGFWAVLGGFRWVLRGFEWAWDGFWVGFGWVWVFGLEVCLGGKCFGLESGVFGFRGASGRVLEGRVWLRGASCRGVVGRCNKQMEWADV